MQIPLQITFRNMKPIKNIEELVNEEAKKLETFYGRLMGCRVAIELPHTHHKHGNLYHVRIDLTLPGSEIVVKHEPSLHKGARRAGSAKMRKGAEVAVPHSDVMLAVRDAFKAAGRRLQDYARRQRMDVKTHEEPAVGSVRQLFPKEGYGFLEAADGREIYFNKSSVLRGGFKRLRAGTQVIFVEETGDKGPQASTVRTIGKPTGRQKARAAGA